VGRLRNSALNYTSSGMVGDSLAKSYEAAMMCGFDKKTGM
jgi:hypothetical protein